MDYADDCQSHPESHTGNNILEELEVIMQEWKSLQDNLSAMSTGSFSTTSIASSGVRLNHGILFH